MGRDARDSQGVLEPKRALPHPALCAVQIPSILDRAVTATLRSRHGAPAPSSAPPPIAGCLPDGKQALCVPGGPCSTGRVRLSLPARPGGGAVRRPTPVASVRVRPPERALSRGAAASVARPRAHRCARPCQRAHFSLPMYELSSPSEMQFLSRLCSPLSFPGFGCGRRCPQAQTSRHRAR